MNNVIALSGKKKSGKTEAFISFYKILHNQNKCRISLLIPIPYNFKIDIRHDYVMVCMLNKKRIGVLSRCDVPGEYKKYLKHLFRLNCDVIITVVHTPKSKSWQILANQFKNHNIKYIDINRINKSKVAHELIKELRNLL